MCLLCLWSWYVGTSERHDGSEQNKNFVKLDEKLEVDKIIMNKVLVSFVNGVGTVTYNDKGYSKAICTANFMADAAYPSGYYTQLGVIAANGIINFYTNSTSNGKLYVAYILGLIK